MTAVITANAPLPGLEQVAVPTDVTPAMARAWLAHNEKNRPKNADAIKALASDMAEGRFHYTGDPIRFDVNGNLIDGQHRLEAIILADATVRIAVLRGLPPEAQEFIDIGRSRSIGDRLAMHDVDNRALRAGIARVMLGYHLGSVGTVVNPRGVSSSRVIEFLREVDTDYGVLVGQCAQRARIGTPSTMGAAAQIAHRVDPAGADEFFLGQLLDGLGLAHGQPALALRNRLLAGGGKTVGARSDVFWLTLRAFVLHQEGRRVSKIQTPKGGWSTDTVPHPMVPAHH